MIFPRFPGVPSFFQVFQVEWEPCLIRETDLDQISHQKTKKTSMHSNTMHIARFGGCYYMSVLVGEERVSVQWVSVSIGVSPSREETPPPRGQNDRKV